MTAITGQNSFSTSATGPTPGYPRTAASVNTGLQQAMDNTTALAYGYARKRSASIVTAATHTNLFEEYFHGTAGGTSDTANQTFEFAPVAVNHYWKHLRFERLTQDTILTFKGGASPSTFLTWKAPADMSDVWLRFNHSSSADTWTLLSAEWTRGNAHSIAYVSGSNDLSTYATPPREIYVYPASGTTLGNGLRVFSLNGDYNSGDRITVFVRGLAAATEYTIRDGSSNDIIVLNAVRDGHDPIVDLIYRAGTWDVMSVRASTRTTESTDGNETFARLTSATQTLNLNRKYHSFDTTFSSNATLTVPDGTWIGQEIHILIDGIGFGATLSISFDGGGSSNMFKAGFVNFQYWHAVWDGSRWWVTSTSF